MKKNLTIGNRQTGETLTMLVSEEENCGTLQPAYGIPSAKFLPMVRQESAWAARM